MRAGGIGVLMVLAAFAAGCTENSDEAATSQTSTPRITATPSTHAIEDASAYAIPDTIDEEYVEQVMRALDHQYGEAARAFMKDGGASPAVLARLEHLYSANEYELQLEFWQGKEDELLESLSATPGDPSTEVEEIFKASNDCVFAEVERDFGNIHKRPTEPKDYRFIVLVPKPVQDTTYNPTPWVLALDVFISSPDEIPVSPC